MDEKIDKLNRKISRVLGKKDDTKPNYNGNNDDEDIIGDGLYVVITIICVIFLWISTGIYYVGGDEYGIILSDGVVSEVVKGPRMGITLPFPMSHVRLIDSDASYMKDLRLANDGSTYNLLSSDNIPISIDAQYSAQVVDPIKLFNTTNMASDNINDTVRLNTLASVYSLCAKESYVALKGANLTILANQIRANVNQKLNKVGLSVAKLNITKLFNTINMNIAFNNSNDNVEVATEIANKLIKEANNYKLDQIAQAKSNVNTYNELLVEYERSPQAVMEQMYYDTVAEINSIKTTQHYDYLFLSLSELYGSMFDYNNQLNRNVTRERVISR